MKLLSALLIPALVLPAAAAVPRKKNVNEYSHLWNDSLFTSKPLPPPPAERVSAFADWTLGGVSEIPGGYLVTLFNIKKQGESMIIRPDSVVVSRGDAIEYYKPGDAGTFAVTRVEYGSTSWKDIVVTLSSGGQTGPVRFDEKQIQPKTVAAPPPQQGRPPGIQPMPGQPPSPPLPGGQQTGGQRQPRQRVTTPQPQQGQPQQNQQAPGYRRR